MVEQVGAGASGRVYRCLDTLLGGREVAIKVFPAEICADRVAAARLVRELRAGFRVESPFVAKFYDVIRTPRCVAFSMEHVAGVSLDNAEIGGLSVTQKVVILLGVAEGLKALHRHGLIHRDLKPSNIMVTTAGVARIVDLGLVLPTGSYSGRASVVVSFDAYVSLRWSLRTKIFVTMFRSLASFEENYVSTSSIYET